MLYEDVDFKTLSDRYTNNRMVSFLTHTDGVGTFIFNKSSAINDPHYVPFIEFHENPTVGKIISKALYELLGQTSCIAQRFKVGCKNKWFSKMPNEAIITSRRVVTIL